jgi:hypothetical protein
MWHFFHELPLLPNVRKNHVTTLRFTKLKLRLQQFHQICDIRVESTMQTHRYTQGHGRINIHLLINK